MTRSHKKAVDYYSDEYRKNCKGSERRVYRKKVRDALCNNSHSVSGVDLLPSEPSRKLWGRVPVLSDSYQSSLVQQAVAEYYEIMSDPAYSPQLLKEQVKENCREEKWEEECSKRSSRKNWKMQRKLALDGLKHPYEEDSTDSEEEKEIEKAVKTQQKQINSTVKENVNQVRRFLDNESYNSFKFYRKFNNK
ncbi:hypothetical protein C9374_011165 [Naegleria lovaniensis]|uniref:Uncharacterized protein n=1 Tax=Naegleria lovaniensis TaxID=51637 RepID=A0AA88GH94_NAELO|nr:uncharacterized protein C9374_011165 [Naegleria lovaniensis]KAG2374086.1 hypothetical protein C9374_011165 [Naegleria lovaniensis]